jgi:hypothetical protein
VDTDINPEGRCPKNNNSINYLQLFEAEVHLAQMKLEEAEAELREAHALVGQ